LTSTGAEIIRFKVIDDETFEYIANKPETIERFVKFLKREKPKVVLFVSPDNPTVQILSDEFVKKSYETVSKFGGTIVMDLAYKELIFDEIPEYFSWAPDGNFITLHSNSKWGRNLGRRLGWVEAPSNVIEGFETFQNSSILCPDRMHQIVFANYFEKTLEDGSFKRYVEETAELYKKTSRVMVEAIENYIKLPYFVPKGGLYTCIKVGENSARFVKNLLAAKSVLVIPGWGFGNSLSESVRLSFGPLVYNHELMVEGIKRIGEYLSK
jgi:aspartate aminotransferase